MVHQEPQDGQRAGLVQWAVAVAALGGLHAGRAALRALAGRDGPRRRLDPASRLLEAAFGEARPAGPAVVDEHGGGAGVRVQDHRDASDVPAVVRGDERHHADHRVLGRVQGAGKAIRGQSRGDELVRGRLEPHRRGEQVPRRQVEGLLAEHLPGGQGLALEGHHLGADLHIPEAPAQGALPRVQAAVHRHDLDLRDVPGLRGEVRPGARDHHRVRVLVQLLHEVRAVLVHVHRAGMRLVVGLGRVHRAQQGTGLGVDDVHGPAAVVPQGDHAGGVLGVRPEPAGRPTAQQPLLDQHVQQGAHPLRLPEPAERLGRDRQLRGGRAQLRAEQVRVLRVHHGVLHAQVEHGLRVVHHERVQGVVRGHEERERVLAAAPGAADLLEERRAGARPAGHHHRVQPRDVDAHLQRRRRGHAQQPTRAQVRLQLPPLLGQVARAVGRDPRAEPRLDLLELPLGRAGDGLGPAPRADERQRAHLLQGQVRDQVGGGGHRRAADGRAVLAPTVRQLRLPERHRDRPVRGRVLGDGRGRRPDQSGEVPGRIRRRRRRPDEHGLRTVPAVVGGDAPQPAQQDAHLRAEDAPVGVRLVHHHERQVPEERGPPLVVRQDPHVEHVRVGHEHGGVLAGPDPVLRCGVAVVGSRAQPRGAVPLEGAPGGQLVRREGLGGGEVERGGPGVGGQPGADRQLVAQRLARRRARGEHGVRPRAGQGRGAHLVQPRPLDAARRERPDQALRSVRGPVRVPGLPCGQLGDVADLLGQPGPAQRRTESGPRRDVRAQVAGCRDGQPGHDVGHHLTDGLRLRSGGVRGGVVDGRRGVRRAGRPPAARGIRPGIVLREVAGHAPMVPVCSAVGLSSARPRPQMDTGPRSVQARWRYSFCPSGEATSRPRLISPSLMTSEVR